MQIMRFLVVDDQISARNMLCQIVSNHPSWSIVGAAINGVEALTQMDREPDVVLMDIVMPEMDGLEVTRQIKNRAPDTVVILTTAYQDREFRTRSLKAGADGFVLKDNLSTEVLEKIILKKGGKENE